MIPCGTEKQRPVRMRNSSTSEKKLWDPVASEERATGEAPTSRTVCLTWPVVRVLSNHDDSDFAQRGIIRP